MEPAIRYAEEGFTLQPTVGAAWQGSYRGYDKLRKTGKEFEPWFDTFAPGGVCPGPGDYITLKDHGKTLRKIAETMAEDFYRGELAQRIDDFSKEFGGFISKEDLADYYPEWVEPISVEYRGYQVHEIPPNGHGITTLMALNILKEMDLDVYKRQYENHSGDDKSIASKKYETDCRDRKSD